MKRNQFRLFFGTISVVIIFFILTYFKNWDVAVAEKTAEDMTPIVNRLKNNYLTARKQCPTIIKRIESGIPNLQKKNETVKLYRSYKLIADCQMAAHQFDDAAKTFTKFVEAEPQAARWHGLLADALFKAGKLGEALPVSHLAVQLDTDNFTYRILEARILAKLNLNNRAITAYGEAIKIAPYKELEKVNSEYEALLEVKNQLESDS